MDNNIVKVIEMLAKRRRRCGHAQHTTGKGEKGQPNQVCSRLPVDFGENVLLEFKQIDSTNNFKSIINKFKYN